MFQHVCRRVYRQMYRVWIDVWIDVWIEVLVSRPECLLVILSAIVDMPNHPLT